MIGQNSPGGSVGLLLLMVGLLLFVSPLALWWANVGLSWHFPFLLWLGYIARVALTTRCGSRHGL